MSQAREEAKRRGDNLTAYPYKHLKSSLMQFAILVRSKMYKIEIRTNGKKVAYFETDNPEYAYMFLGELIDSFSDEIDEILCNEHRIEIEEELICDGDTVDDWESYLKDWF